MLVVALFLLISSVSGANVSTRYDYLLTEVFKCSAFDIPPSIRSDPTKSFIDYYHDGVQAYLENDWESCVNHIERSLIMYRNYYDSVTICRLNCEDKSNRYVPKYKEDFDHRHFYERLVYKTLCIERCRRKKLDGVPRFFIFNNDEKEIFKRRKPYEYLQLCYYRENEIEKAISATYTALTANPGDNLLKKNILFYSTLQQFDFDKLKDFEDKRFSPVYQDGVDKFEAKEYQKAIDFFEIAIDIWLQEHDKCRAFCEGEFYQGWMPDFTTSVANHYVFGVRCKRNCTTELSYVNGRFYEDLFPSMYNYLQYSYYQMGNKKEAVRCAVSFLLFFPKHEEMLNNIEFYKVQADVTKDFFKPREEARKFFYREFYEEELLKFIDDEFVKLNKEARENNF